MTRRAGGWILALLVVGAMAGGGGFALRRTFNRELVTVVMVQSPSDRGPTGKAILRGAGFALEETGRRAGRYRVSLHEREPVTQSSLPDTVVAWIGTSEALLSRGHQQGRPFQVSVFDTHPADPCWERQGACAARWAKKIGRARATLLHDSESLTSRAIGAAFETAARAQGVQVEGPLDATLENIDRILASKPDLIFYSGEEAPYVTATKIFAALREKGFAGRLATGEADPEVSYLATRTGPVDGTYLVSPFAPASPDLAARMGFVPGPHVTAGYDAMKRVLDTIDRADSVAEDDLHRVAAALQTTRPCALYVAKNGVYEFVELLE